MAISPRHCYIAIKLCSVALAMCLPVQAQLRDKPVAPPQAQPLREPVTPELTYQPISGKQRIQWAAVQTFGQESLLVGVLSSGIETARDAPEEYGPHWGGFAKRYGMRFTGTASSKTIEAGLGALWAEDPRYFRDDSLSFKKRLGHVILFSFAARNREGRLMPAYARYIAIPGNNFLSNTWRVNSEATAGDAMTRTAYGILSEIAGNAWSEFWPDVKRKIFRK